MTREEIAIKCSLAGRSWMVDSSTVSLLEHIEAAGLRVIPAAPDDAEIARVGIALNTHDEQAKLACMAVRDAGGGG